MKKVLFVVAHPDDVACGMGGTAAILSSDHELHILCASKGERGCPDWSMEKTAGVREAEERKAADLIGVELHFMGLIDGEVFADFAACRLAGDWVEKIDPDVVYTIWPVDNHADHSAVSEIAKKAVMLSGKQIDIVYCEEGQTQTRLFTPDRYVDISPVIQTKLEMIRCHECQNKGDVLALAAIERAAQRGAENGTDYAEAFRVYSPGAFGAGLF